MLNLMPRNFYLDEIFDEMNKDNTRSINQMKCDIYENEKEYHIEMDIPGYKKEEIKIESNKDLLTVTAKKHLEKEQNRKYIRKERFYGKVSRSFSFTDIDEDNIDAKFENGTLFITIPKKDKDESKKIISIK
jgi:HSP20 family protein